MLATDKTLHNVDLLDAIEWATQPVLGDSRSTEQRLLTLVNDTEPALAVHDYILYANMIDATAIPDEIFALASESDIDSLLEQTNKLHALSQSFNDQYLRLQDKMAAENRMFSTVSNVMKMRHDTTRAMIRNIR